MMIQEQPPKPKLLPQHMSVSSLSVRDHKALLAHELGKSLVPAGRRRRPAPRPYDLRAMCVKLATAAVVAAAAIVAAAATAVAAPTIATDEEEDNQDDDPRAAATKTITTTHTNFLLEQA